jgi:hypothetical protein
MLASFTFVSFCGGGVIVTLLDAAEGRRDAEVVESMKNTK